jgi:hypothetical protein
MRTRTDIRPILVAPSILFVPRLRDLERSLLRPAAGTFGEHELDGLPEPVQRLFRAAIAPGTPLARSARIEMRGEIRLKRWTSFRGTEVLTPLEGFVWAVRAGVISGYDRYVEGEGELRWKLLGLIPVMRAGGADVSRSAAGRCVAEGVWLPTALLPRFGVEWSAEDDLHLTARLRLDAHEVEVHLVLDDEARVRACWFDRWGDPDGTGAFALHPFGMETAAHRAFGGVTIAAAGRAGWHWGTDRWPDAAFFRYELTGLEPAGPAS